MNKRGFEILYNIQILCFIKHSKIKEMFSLVKKDLCENENEIKYIQYYENFWLKKTLNYTITVFLRRYIKMKKFIHYKKRK